VNSSQVAVRWTVGDVSPQGFEALRLSIWGAWRIFGASARYGVCVNSMTLEDARERTGALPVEVLWHDASGQVPPFLATHLDSGMAEGVGWKFSPLRLFPGRWEISLDNDCILWELPAALRAWLEEGDTGRCALAEDVRACFGQFADLCGPEPRNSGIRGLPAGFDLEAALRRVLDERPVALTSELDEQGLQVAALSAERPPHVVSLDDVAICSPFPPHLPHLGRAGAHFVGLNMKRSPFLHGGRPALELLREHWARLRPALEAHVFAPPDAPDHPL
jgi:hypothetical protein